MSFTSDDILDLQNIGLRNQKDKHDVPLRDKNPFIQTSSRRWLVLLTFSFILIMNSFNLNEYFDIEEAIKKFYDKSFTFTKKIDSIYWQELFNLFTYGSFLLPAMILIQLKGIWFSCLIGIILTTFGSWIKCASIKSEQFSFLISGQILCAISQAFIVTPLVKISSSWFALNEIATATSVFILNNC